MAKVTIPAEPNRVGSKYAPPYDHPLEGIRRWKLGDPAGLTQFGVNLLRVPPGQWSAQRHWHTAQDEFVWVLEGEVVLVTDDGEQVLRPGDCAAFPAGVANGHHLRNRGAAEAVILEVGTRPEADRAFYPDVPGGMPY